MLKVGVGQIGSVVFDTAATMYRVEAVCREAAIKGVRLLVLPEALLGGYPKGLDFGATVGSRTNQGRDMYLRYSRAAVCCPGAETERLTSLTKELDMHLVIGVVERAGHTLYCSSLVFAPDRGLILNHRKLMPTGTERVVWGMGDGSTMQVVDTDLGRIGTAICWENYMPLYRQHLYDQGVDLWCAPTVDSRDIWQASMRHIAYEGRCFVLSACQHLTHNDWPADMRAQGGVIQGSSMICSPFGEFVAGPSTEHGLLVAEIDRSDIQRGKFDLDVAGHYSRPDIFSMSART